MRLLKPDNTLTSDSSNMSALIKRRSLAYNLYLGEFGYPRDGWSMKQYLDLVRTVLENGEKREDRTGTGTISMFGMQTKFDLREGFPLLTTKKVKFDGHSS